MIRRLSRKDFFVLLPYKQGNTTFNKTFIYPESDRNMNGAGNPLSADDDGDDTVELTDEQGNRYRKVHVQKTYILGGDLDPNDPVERDDPYQQYSYAFKIKRSRIDTNGDGVLDRLSDSLFEVTIMVYRNFSPVPTSKKNEPVREFVTLISL
jgi:hypothetical protein